MNRFFRFFVAFTAMMIALTSSAEGLGGEWKGDLQVTPQVKLKLVFHISEPTEDPAVVTLDSPDQGAFAIPTEVNLLTNDSIDISVKQLNLNFTGKREGDKIEGTFKQNGMSIPLILDMASPEESQNQGADRSFPVTKDDLKIFKKKPTDIEFA